MFQGSSELKNTLKTNNLDFNKRKCLVRQVKVR